MDSIVSNLIRHGGAVWRALAGLTSGAGIPATTRVLPAYAALARHQISTTNLDPRLRMLVTQLAAERSGCRWCIEQGRHLWRDGHFSLEMLHALPRHETSSLFSNRERAALQFTDAVTRYADRDGGMPLEPLMKARQHLSEPEIVAVTAAVAEKHYFNPITGALGADVAPVRSVWL